MMLSSHLLISFCSCDQNQTLQSDDEHTFNHSDRVIMSEGRGFVKPTHVIMTH